MANCREAEHRRSCASALRTKGRELREIRATAPAVCHATIQAESERRTNIMRDYTCWTSMSVRQDTDFPRYRGPEVVFDSRWIPRFEPVIGQFLRLKYPWTFCIDVQISDVSLSILSSILKGSRFESNIRAFVPLPNRVVLLPAFATKHQRHQQL